MLFCFAEKAKTAFNNPGAFAWCHYVVKQGEPKGFISVLWIRNFFSGSGSESDFGKVSDPVPDANPNPDSDHNLAQFFK